MKKTLYLLIFFIIFPIGLNAQWILMKSDADSLVKLGTDYIYNVEFDKAEDCFNQVKDIYPGHPAGYFLDAMVDWWRITLYRRTEQFDEPFLDKIEEVKDICNDILEDEPTNIVALFFKGGALGFEGRYHALRKNWFSAAMAGKEAYEILIQCYLKAPGNSDIMLGTGIYNYFAAAIPEQYSILQPMVRFFPKGDKNLGIMRLKTAAKHARYASTEAKVVLLQIYYSFEDNLEEAEKIAEELHQKYPGNPYFHRYLGRIYVRRGYWKLFESEWREILNRCIDKKPAYDLLTAREAMYYIGTALMKKGENDLALKYILKSSEGSEILDEGESGFLAKAYLKIAKLYDKLGNRALASEYYNKVLDVKNYDNTHKQAEMYLKTPFQ